ncbi:MAG: metallophosphoesterase family protein [Planctomycetota bacterium]
MAALGLISDTHGLVRSEAVEALRGVDRILHMGDVGGAEVLEQLEAIAPVSAVRGNTDHGAWADDLPMSLTLDTHGMRVHLVHDIDTLDLDPMAADIGVVLFGHSHKPHEEERDGVLYVNPGAAGPRRFNLPVSVALLRSGPKVEFVTLG